LILLRPLRLFLSAEQVRSARIVLLKITHFPFVAAIWAYESAAGRLQRISSRPTSNFSGSGPQSYSTPASAGVTTVAGLNGHGGNQARPQPSGLKSQPQNSNSSTKTRSWDRDHVDPTGNNPPQQGQQQKPPKGSSTLAQLVGTLSGGVGGKAATLDEQPAPTTPQREPAATTTFGSGARQRRPVRFPNLGSESGAIGAVAGAIPGMKVSTSASLIDPAHTLDGQTQAQQALFLQAQTQNQQAMAEVLAKLVRKVDELSGIVSAQGLQQKRENNGKSESEGATGAGDGEVDSAGENLQKVLKKYEDEEAEANAG
jgi:hypothetical protein